MDLQKLEQFLEKDKWSPWTIYGLRGFTKT